MPLQNQEQAHIDRVCQRIEALKGARSTSNDPLVEQFLNGVRAWAPRAYGEACELVRADDPNPIRAIIRSALGETPQYSPETGAHVREVFRLTALCAESLMQDGALSQHQGAKLCVAAVGHDLGKLDVPLGVLHQPGKLDGEGREAMNRHAIDGHFIMDGVLRPWDRDIKYIVGRHHENEKGTGYPFGLAGGEQALTEKVLQITDRFEAATAERCYQERLTTAPAIAMLRRKAAAGEINKDVLEALIPTLRAFGHERDRVFKVNSGSNLLLPQGGDIGIAGVQTNAWTDTVAKSQPPRAR